MIEPWRCLIEAIFASGVILELDQVDQFADI